MLNRILLFVLIMSFIDLAQSANDGYEKVFLKTEFNEFKSNDKISDIITALKVSVNTNDKNIIANPNGKFNKTDIVKVKNLPWRRLIFAGKSKQYCFIYYEVGGIEYHISFIMFRLDKDKLNPVLALTMYKKMESTEQLKKFIYHELPIETINSISKKINQNKYIAHKIEVFKYDINKLDYGF